MESGGFSPCQHHAFAGFSRNAETFVEVRISLGRASRPADRQPVPLDTNLIHYKQLKVSGTTRASLTQFRKTLRFISSGVLNVKPLITRTLPLTAIGQALDYAAAADGLKNVILF